MFTLMCSSPAALAPREVAVMCARYVPGALGEPLTTQLAGTVSVAPLMIMVEVWVALMVIPGGSFPDATAQAMVPGVPQIGIATVNGVFSNTVGTVSKGRLIFADTDGEKQIVAHATRGMRAIRVIVNNLFIN
jgi:hypothetical protein